MPCGLSCKPPRPLPRAAGTPLTRCSRAAHALLTRYAHLPHGCSRCPARSARQLLDLGVKPDTSTFNCLLKACMRARDARRAGLALQWMGQARVAADEITYNTLIKVRGEGLRSMVG